MSTIVQYSLSLFHCNCTFHLMQCKDKLYRWSNNNKFKWTKTIETNTNQDLQPLFSASAATPAALCGAGGQVSPAGVLVVEVAPVDAHGVVAHVGRGRGGLVHWLVAVQRHFFSKSFSKKIPLSCFSFLCFALLLWCVWVSVWVSHHVGRLAGWPTCCVVVCRAKKVSYLAKAKAKAKGKSKS